MLRNDTEKECRHWPVCISGSQLLTVSSCCDLGIIISNDLSPSEIVFKVYQRANLIFCCFFSNNTSTCLCHICPYPPAYVGGVNSVVERRPLAGGLSLSHARPAANGWPLTWVSHGCRSTNYANSFHPFVVDKWVVSWYQVPTLTGAIWWMLTGS